MRTFSTIILFFCLTLLNAQRNPGNIEVNKSEAGTSAKVDLDLFHLNHVLYIKAFVLSDIYSKVSPEEMGYINNTLLKNLSEGYRTQFIIQTEEKVPYRLAVFAVENEEKMMLVILTNFDPEKGSFEKKIKDHHYATTADIVDGVVIGNMFEMPLSDEEKCEKEKDYTCLININIFSRKLNTDKIETLIKKADETQKVLVNNLNWLKSYYYLAQNDFTQAYNYLNSLEKSVKKSPEGEQNQWAMYIKVLRAEIEILKYIVEY